MYKLAHFLRDKLPFIWYLADCLNAVLFSARYGGRMERVPGILKEYSKSYEIIGMSMMSAEDMERFFASQPEDSFRYFKPHGFDAKSLRKLQGNKAFLAYVVRENGNPVGYFFLRSFFFGKAYLGKLTDHAHQGQGVGKMMCLCAMDIASTLGLRMYETISRDNMASLHSTQNVLETRIVKEMPDNYLMIEDIRKKANVA
jgi:hypothetical protein